MAQPWATEARPERFQIMCAVRFFGVLVALVVLGGALGCGKGAIACGVVDAAERACTVVRYMGPDGKVQEVQVDPDEMTAFGRAMAAKRNGEPAPCLGDDCPEVTEPKGDKGAE